MSKRQEFPRDAGEGRAPRNEKAASDKKGREGSPEAPTLDTRVKILETAEIQFSRGGYEAVGMREMAAAVGLSKSALFHHFPTKLELYEEVLCRVLTRLEEGLSGANTTVGDPLQRLDAWLDSVVKTLAEDAPAARLLLRALVEDRDESAAVDADGGPQRMPSELQVLRILGRFEALIQEGVDQRVFRPLSIIDAVQTTVGAIVFHFASGDLGEELIGESIFSAAAVERRRTEVAEFIRRGFLE